MVNQAQYEAIARRKLGGACGDPTEGADISKIENRRIAHALNILPQNVGRLLDIGCASGALLCWVRKTRDYEEIAGVEICPTYVEFVRSLGITCSHHDFEAESLGCYDWITCLDTIEHILDPVSFLVNIRKSLAPAGKLLFTTFNISYGRFLESLLLDKEFPFPRAGGDTEIYDVGHLHYWAHKNMSALLADCGFSKWTIHNISDPYQFRNAAIESVCRAADDFEVVHQNEEIVMTVEVGNERDGINGAVPDDSDAV